VANERWQGMNGAIKTQGSGIGQSCDAVHESRGSFVRRKDLIAQHGLGRVRKTPRLAVSCYGGTQRAAQGPLSSVDGTAADDCP